MVCSVSASSKTVKQFSGPRFARKCRKEAPERGKGNSSGWKRAIFSSGLNWTKILGRSGLGNGTSYKKWLIQRSSGMSKGPEENKV